jgi:hypothetical protein
MWQGWTKNLALLFGNALALAGMRLLQMVVLVVIPVLIVVFWRGMGGPHALAPSAGVLGAPMAMAALTVVWIRALWGFYRRAARSNFPFRDYVWSPLGIPLYAAMLGRSWFRHAVLKQVVWKGRDVDTSV